MPKQLAIFFYLSCLFWAAFVSQAKAQTAEDISVAVLDTEIGRIKVYAGKEVSAVLGQDVSNVVFDATEEVAALTKKLRNVSPAFRLEISKFPWEIHFVDSREGSFPGECSPASMIPPATLRVAVDRLVGPCLAKKKLPESLQEHFPVQVLVHEMAHPIEFVAGGKGYHQDPMLREGFATWFEQAAASDPELFQFHRERAQESLRRDGLSFSFQGAERHYSRAAQYFQVLVERGGLAGLASLYQFLSEGDSLETALMRSAGLNRQSWERIVNEYTAND